MWCYRRALRISYVEHVSNDEVLGRVQQTRKLGSRIRLQKLRHFGHVSRHPSLQADIMLGKVPGVRRQGGQRMEWLTNITDWTGQSLPSVVNLARNRSLWRSLIHKSAYAPKGVGHTWTVKKVELHHYAKFHQNRSSRNLVWWRILGLRMGLEVEISNFWKSKMADGRHLEKLKNRHISAAVWAISTTFGRQTQFEPLDRPNR